jgi:hypothetical protein
MRDSWKMSYTKHLLSSSSSLKNKEVLANHGGGKIEGSGSSFGKHYGSCLLSPLNMAPICVLSYSWVICLSLSHTNPMSPHTPSTSPEEYLVIVALCFGLSLSRVNVAKSFFVPHNVQGKFHFKPTTLQYYHISSSCQYPYSFDLSSYITFLC